VLRALLVVLAVLVAVLVLRALAMTKLEGDDAFEGAPVPVTTSVPPAG
jgi:hypothetical protein